MPLQAGNDAGFWVDLVNLRLRQQGIYTVWEPRKGTAYLDESLNNVDGGTVLSLDAFRARPGSVTYLFLIIHTSTGGCYYFDLDSETLTDIVDPNGSEPLFSTSTPLFIINIGRFVYLFDADTNRHRIWNIEKEELTDWYGSAPAGINSVAEGNHPFGGDWPEEHVFGFREGATVIGLPYYAAMIPISTWPRQNYLWQAQPMWFVFKEDDDRERLELSTGTEIRSSGIYFLPRGVGVRATDEKSSDSLASEAHRPDVEFLQMMRTGELIPPNSNNNQDGIFKPRTVEISGIEDLAVGGEPGFPLTLPLVKELGREFLPYEPEGSAPTRLLRILLPLSPDTRPYLDDSGRWEFDAATYELVEREAFEIPVLNRAYAVVHVMGDGSVTLPGPPILASVDTKDIMENYITHIKLDIPAAPAGVAKRYLVCTRWHLSEENAFRPTSETNPNGTFFIHSELGNDAYTGSDVYVDDKADDRLLRELSEIVPMAAGIPLLFGAGQLNPQYVAQYGTTLFAAGYRVDRPLPEKDVTVQVGTNATPEDRDVLVQFDYSNGDRSAMVTIVDGVEVTSVIRMSGLNALITKVTVAILKDDTCYRLVTFGADSPHFAGAGITVPDFADIEALEEFEPAEAEGGAAIGLGEYVVPVLPGQQSRIDQQVPVADSSEIQAFIPLSFDRDKSFMRFRALVQTRNNVQIGYITEQDTGLTTLTRGEFEVVFSGLGTPNGRGAKRMGDAVYLAGDKGLYRIRVAADGRIGQPELLIDRDRYPAARFPLLQAAQHEREHEFLFVFSTIDVPSDGRVFVVDEGWAADAGGATTQGRPARSARQPLIREYRYPGLGAAGPLVYFEGKLIGAFGDSVVDYEGSTGADHKDFVIAASAVSAHLLDDFKQVRLLNTRVTGRNVKVRPEADLQPARRRGSPDTWAPSFSSDTDLPEKPASMQGALWDIRRQAIMPRIRLLMDFSDGGEVHGVRLRFVEVRNAGRAGTNID